MASKEIMDELKKVFRIGRIHSFDATARTARVKFEDRGGIISAPIKVVSRPRTIIPASNSKTANRTAGTELNYDKNGALTKEAHSHAAYVTDWNPKVNSLVLCIFMPDGGGDGYVIGEV